MPPPNQLKSTCTTCASLLNPVTPSSNHPTRSATPPSRNNVRNELRHQAPDRAVEPAAAPQLLVHVPVAAVAPVAVTQSRPRRPAHFVRAEVARHQPSPPSVPQMAPALTSAQHASATATEDASLIETPAEVTGLHQPPASVPPSPATHQADPHDLIPGCQADLGKDSSLAP